VSIRGIGDGYAFTRLLWLLVGTVIVPTILLALFGVAAIRNQGAAVLREVDRLRAEQLEAGARTLAHAITSLEGRALTLAGSCTTPDCPLLVPGTTSSWRWVEGAPLPDPLLQLGIPTGMARPGDIVWLSPVDGSPPVGVTAAGDQRFAWRLDPVFLQGELDSRLDDRLPEHTSLVLSGPEPGSSYTIEQLLARSPDRAELDLPMPLLGWRLKLVEDEQHPSRAVLLRNAWLYPASLAILVAVVLIGTVVTLGSASREIKLSRLQTDFVSSVSHDLRTPLTSIRLFVETLQSGRLQDPAKVGECLDLLALETERLNRMIERVLDWARMEAGRRIYQFEAVPPHQIATDALRALRSQRLLAAEPDPIEVYVPPDLPDVRVDQDAIVEAMLNLLQNAVKHTSPPRRIVLRGLALGRWVALSVEDNGPGIAKRDRRRIFEKFYQVDTRLSSPTQGKVERGSGLGLSIVRSVARAHGGRVELQSEVGRGSRFTLWLPTVEPTR
jgi:two-component system phosphate regulon sensor histidine kinase PhoR